MEYFSPAETKWTLIVSLLGRSCFALLVDCEMRWSHQDLAFALANNRELKIARPLRLVTKVPIPHTPKHDYKEDFLHQLKVIGVKVEPEFKFSERRKYRADWRVTEFKKSDVRDEKILIEFEGGIFSSGKRGHSSINGILRDIEKSNEAQLCGYRVIRIAPNHVSSGIALDWLIEMLGGIK